MIGKETAAKTIQRLGTFDPEAIVGQEGLPVATLDLRSTRFRELFVPPVIFIPVDCTPVERRSLLAHALGHHYLHDCNQLWLRGFDRIWNWKQERQVEEFAAWLLIPEGDTPELVGLTIGEVAARYEVDVALAGIRLGL
jgi:Zn-dependent peptidase ImmA (M78 family)